MNNYFNKFLGRSLNKEETKGKQCIRVYTDNNGNLSKARIYNLYGYQVLEFNFGESYSERDNMKKCKNPPSIEEESTIKLLDIQKALKNCIKSDGSLIIKKKASKMVFKKIPDSPYDLYIHDPYFMLRPNVLSDEYLLYKRGYKMVEAVYLDIDGIVNWGKRRIFNTDGLMAKQEYYQGTPWGGTVNCESIEWRYEFDKKKIIMKHINTYKDFVDRKSEYELNKNGNIIRHWEFLRHRRSKHKEKMFLWREHFYKYDNNGRVIFVKTMDLKEKKRCLQTGKIYL